MQHTISVGLGKNNPGGLTRKPGTLEQLAQVISDLDGVEAHWCPAAFAGDHRSQENFESCSLVWSDVDFHDEHGEHVAVTAAGIEAWTAAFDAGSLPGELAHRSPRGFRLVGRLDRPVTDGPTMRRANQGFNALIQTALDKANLSDVGFAVDTGVAKDSARFLYAPNATVRGTKRVASWRNGRAVEPYAVDDLLAVDLTILNTLPGDETPQEAPQAPRTGYIVGGKGGKTFSAADDLRSAVRACLDLGAGSGSEYDNWWRVIAALRRTAKKWPELNARLRDLAHAWSQQCGGEYDPKEVDAKWDRGFEGDSEREIKLGTLVTMASNFSGEPWKTPPAEWGAFADQEPERPDDLYDDDGCIRVYTAADIEAYTPPDRPWYADAVLMKGETITNIGHSGAGKTFWIRFLIRALCEGASSFGGLTLVGEKLRILYVCEQSANVALMKFQQEVATASVRDWDLEIVTRDRALKAWDSQQRVVDDVLRLHNRRPYDAVFIDTLRSFGFVDNENDNAELRKTIQLFQHIANEGPATSLTHHTNKAATKGSVQQLAGAGAGVVSALSLQTVGIWRDPGSRTTSVKSVGDVTERFADMRYDPEGRMFAPITAEDTLNEKHSREDGLILSALTHLKREDPDAFWSISEIEGVIRSHYGAIPNGATSTGLRPMLNRGMVETNGKTRPKWRLVKLPDETPVIAVN